MNVCVNLRQNKDRWLYEWRNKFMSECKNEQMNVQINKLIIEQSWIKSKNVAE